MKINLIKYSHDKSNGFFNAHFQLITNQIIINQMDSMLICIYFPLLVYNAGVFETFIYLPNINCTTFELVEFDWWWISEVSVGIEISWSAGDAPYLWNKQKEMCNLFI